MSLPEASPSPLYAVEGIPDFSGLATIAEAQAGEVIASLSLALAAVPGTSFLTHCAFAFRRALGADHFIISRLNPHSNLMRTIRFVRGGKLEANITYSLDGTPCSRAMDSGVCVYPENVAEKFPRDRFLKDEQISGYVGAAMHDPQGNPLGVMLALSRAPIADGERARAVLEHFRIRMASVIATAELIERQDWALSAATDGVWDWDVVTGGTTLSPSVVELLGLKARGFHDLTHIECAIHPEDRERHAQALRAHVTSGAPFSVAVRLPGRDGGWRWHISRGKAMRNEKGRAVRMVGCFIDIDELMAGAGALKGPVA